MKQIQWFPGHMAKAKRLIEEKLPLVDIVFCLIDARIPIASQNPLLQGIIKDKPTLFLLNKADLADESQNQKWVFSFEKQGIPALAVNSLTGNPIKQVVDKSKAILKNVFEKEHIRGMTERPIRAMVIGIPNVGKSQFINKLSGKNKVKTGDKPGVTKMQVFLKAANELELLDNPGVLWPKIESKDAAMYLALIGSIKEDILPIDEICLFGIDFLIHNYPKGLSERYSLENVKEKTALEVLDEIGIRRGCISKGNEIDYERVFKLFLYDFRNMAFGRITIEHAEDV